MKWYDWVFILFMSATAAIFYHFCGALPVAMFFWSCFYVLLREYKKSSDDQLSELKLHMLRLEGAHDMCLHHLVNSATRLSAEILTIKAMLQLQEIRAQEREKAGETTDSTPLEDKPEFDDLDIVLNSYGQTDTFEIGEGA